MLPMIALLAVAVLFEGCQSPEHAAYATMKTTATAVSQGRKAWVDYVEVQRKIVTGNDLYDLEKRVEAVGNAYSKYQAAMRILRKAVLDYKANPENKTALEVALQAVETSGADLVAMIRSFQTQ
jgi:hypothetical protein